MDDTEIWAAVDRRRRAIVELLVGLTRPTGTPLRCVPGGRSGTLRAT